MYYGHKKQAHELQENLHSIEELQKTIEDIQKTLKFKVDGEMMNEEMQQA